MLRSILWLLFTYNLEREETTSTQRNLQVFHCYCICLMSKSYFFLHCLYWDAHYVLTISEVYRGFTLFKI
ncbi:unnamed protein product [Cylicocyclus nassatus]|uniref:Uncharacterized protein n=1 Tax=Cylicocyclus nassatus TaxID=53992 RepID=A0AA36H7L4_CYLNA|nr:unnamed protein product [Cylicocyclus nassatus]